MTIETSGPDIFEVVQTIPCPILKCEDEGTVYVILSIPMELSDWIGNISPTLTFTSIDCDPTTG